MTMSQTTYTLGFSPCPNDTFIFDALVNGKINTGDISFDVVLEDVQTLNEWAIAGKLDFSKISYGVLPLVAALYRGRHYFRAERIDRQGALVRLDIGYE